MSNPFSNYQTDVLFLLVGSNPLPNYVAARLLIKEQGTMVLLHSKSTTNVAKRLASQLQKEQPDLVIQYYTVPEADGPATAIQVENAARAFERSYPRKTVGLNYTGGTKPMAAYTHRVLSQMFPGAVFSYLDARTLSMVVDPGGGPVQYIPVERQVRMTLAQIAALHGYEIKSFRQSSRHVAIAAAIAEVHLVKDGMEQWRKWLETWNNGAKLPDLSRFPALAPAMQGFDQACGGTATENGVAQVLGYERLEQCGKFFVGGWLEDYTLEALHQVRQITQLDDYAAELLLRAPRRPDFDLDIAATIGYQLFAVSCRATDKKGLAKEHLMEVFIRASQMGGDEARFATVTLCDDDNVRDLQREVTEAWDARGKIKVFGRSHIRDLSTYLLRWFREANQEAP
ncbi:MAG: hypothetical protein BroJett021_17380 [Chloroflexota bacterium]|nr:DUF1887 family protein [Caldilinea sp.]GIK72750.1 MAG: hypothetical protein BroJett021_17380 [Chloroflexota bacterium]